jgi:hypothetical protein
MKNHADKKRTERTFTVGEEVFIKLQPYIQQSVMKRSNQKLALAIAPHKRQGFFFAGKKKNKKKTLSLMRCNCHWNPKYIRFSTSHSFEGF